MLREPGEKPDNAPADTNAPRRGPRASGRNGPKPEAAPVQPAKEAAEAKEANAEAKAEPKTEAKDEAPKGDEKPADTQPAAQPPGEVAPVSAPAAASVTPKPEAAPVQPALPPIEGSILGSDVSLDYMKMLVYGDSGSGKTHLISDCDNVAVFSLEPQGRATIRAANPKAMILPCKNMADVRRYLMMAAIVGLGNELMKRGIKTLGFDSITELQQFMIDEIQAEKRAEAEAKNPAQNDGKPAPKGKAPEMTQQDWGVLAVKMRNFLRILRGLDFNVIVLALCEPTVEQNTGIRRLYPKLSGSMQHALPAYFNVVGFLYKVQVAQGKVERVVMLDGPENYLTKSYGPLTGLVVANLRVWFAAIAGNGDATSKTARMPGQGVRAPSVAGRPAAAPTAQPTQDEQEADLGI